MNRYVTGLRDRERDGSIVTLTGDDVETGERIRFAADPRMVREAEHFAFRVYEIEGWQILSVRPGRLPAA